MPPSWILVTWAMPLLCALADWKLRPSPAGRMLLWLLGSAAGVWTAVQLA